MQKTFRSDPRGLNNRAPVDHDWRSFFWKYSGFCCYEILVAAFAGFRTFFADIRKKR
jgi:hypothetical protein